MWAPLDCAWRPLGAHVGDTSGTHVCSGHTGSWSQEGSRWSSGTAMAGENWSVCVSVSVCACCCVCVCVRAVVCTRVWCVHVCMDICLNFDVKQGCSNSQGEPCPPRQPATGCWGPRANCLTQAPPGQTGIVVLRCAPRAVRGSQDASFSRGDSEQLRASPSEGPRVTVRSSCVEDALCGGTAGQGWVGDTGVPGTEAGKGLVPPPGGCRAGRGGHL